jgi:hypothetical protein
MSTKGVVFMSRQELEFLRLVNSTRSNLKALTTPELLSHFIRAERLGHIAKNPTTGAYELTDKGIQRMVFSEDQLEQRKQELICRRKDSRRAWLQWFLSCVISLLCVFLGAYLTLSTHWFDWLQALIQ